MIESSLDGLVWIGAMSGLDAADVQKQFDHIRKQGCKIVNTSIFKYDQKGK